MKHPHLDCEALLQGRLDGLGLASGVADQQYLFLGQGSQERGEPIDPGIMREVRMEGRSGVRVRIGRPFRGQRLEPARIRRKDIQGMQVRHALGEPGDRGAGVPEHHAARAVLIEERVDPGLLDFVVPLSHLRQPGTHVRFSFPQDMGQFS